jgi:hypothetical protein
VGPAGAQGLQGPTGPIGPAGADGADGADGLDGLDGLDGEDGLPRSKTDLYAVVTTLSIPPYGIVTIEAECADNDDVLLTGGCFSQSLLSADVVETYPNDNTLVGTTAGWTCTVQSTTASVFDYTARAVCIDVP